MHSDNVYLTCEVLIPGNGTCMILPSVKWYHKIYHVVAKAIHKLTYKLVTRK